MGKPVIQIATLLVRQFDKVEGAPAVELVAPMMAVGELIHPKSLVVIVVDIGIIFGLGVGLRVGIDKPLEGLGGELALLRDEAVLVGLAKVCNLFNKNQNFRFESLHNTHLSFAQIS